MNMTGSRYFHQPGFHGMDVEANDIHVEFWYSGSPRIKHQAFWWEFVFFSYVVLGFLVHSGKLVN